MASDASDITPELERSLHYLHEAQTEDLLRSHGVLGDDHDDHDDESVTENAGEDKEAPPTRSLSHTKAVEALARLISYLIFLGFIFLVVFINEDNDAEYRLASNFEQRLKTSQSDANFDFYSIQDPTKMFYFLTDVLTPAVTTQSYYNGEPFPDNGGDPLDYQGNYFSDDVGLTLGKIRVSQVRVNDDRCTVAEQFKDRAVGGRVERYKRRSTGISDCSPVLSEETESTTAMFHNGTNQRWTWSSNAGSTTWWSPVTKTVYPKSGFAQDLALGRTGLIRDFNKLLGAGFFDRSTRVMFVDASFFNAQVDHVVIARFAFEQLPTGTIVPTMDIDSAPLFTDLRVLEEEHTKLTQKFHFACEIIMYGCILMYLVTASDDIIAAGSVREYLSNGWNLLDITNVSIFLVIIALRFGWMLEAGRITYNVYKNVRRVDALGYVYYELVYPKKEDWKSFILLRAPTVLWRYSRTMFALGIIVNFMKAFKYVQAFKYLSQFSKTIAVSVRPALSILLLTCIINTAFGTAFHLMFPTVKGYEDFTESIYTLSQLYLGVFDFEELVNVSPVLGAFMFVLFTLVSVVVLMTALLKLVDVSFLQVLHETPNNADFSRLIREALEHMYQTGKKRLLRLQVIRQAKQATDVNPEEVEQFLHVWVVDDEQDEEAQGEDLEGDDKINEAPRTVVDLQLERLKRKRNGPKTVEDEARARRQIVRKYLRTNELEKLTEKDLDPEDLLERVGLLQHRGTILAKLVSRVKNSVEMFTEEGVEDDDQTVDSLAQLGLVKRVQPEEEALRENLSKVTAEDMKVDVLEDREPMQPTLPSIPLDQVGLDEALARPNESNKNQRKTSKSRT